jgi:hypothetical protein
VPAEILDAILDTVRYALADFPAGVLRVLVRLRQRILNLLIDAARVDLKLDISGVEFYALPAIRLLSSVVGVRVRCCMRRGEPQLPTRLHLGRLIIRPGDTGRCRPLGVGSLPVRALAACKISDRKSWVGVHHHEAG